MNRRDFLTGSGFAVSAFTTPVTRWLVPADEAADVAGSRKQVGRADLEELRDAADEARRWDSKYGGGNWKADSVTVCLQERAAPLLRGSFTDEVGRDLFSVTSELSHLAGWTAFDVGQHDVAQRHFIQALRLARAGGDVELGCYVLTTMAMQSLLRGIPSEAVDMAQGAFERAKGHAAPRVLAFTKLIEARAHARERDARAASQALKAALTWNQQAAAMPSGVFARSVGMRLAIVGTAHLQGRDLDHGLDLGNRSVDILARVQSSRAKDNVREFNPALAPWRREPAVREFLHRTRTELGITV
ncbi:sporulation protein [Streptomyces sp. NPDC002659]|uniref:sporulation protein n=1 Tax=Streptomyces sp. NPDC002659 TaxID=3364656 RepID=UPI00368CAE4E